jgi:hypothetical protein
MASVGHFRNANLVTKPVVSIHGANARTNLFDNLFIALVNRGVHVAHTWEGHPGRTEGRRDEVVSFSEISD